MSDHETFFGLENHPEFKSRLRLYAPDQYLFRQGQLGQSMFIILEGVVRLVAERDGEEHVEAIVEAGEFLGEKALLSDGPHQRHFSAFAWTGTRALELNHEALYIIQNESPDIMVQILKRSFEIAAARLDRANHLARVLRSSDNQQRIIDCIRYFCRTAGKKDPKGTKVALSAKGLYYHIDMPLDQIEHFIHRLVEQRLLLKGPTKGYYIVPDEGALLGFIRMPIAA